MKYIPVYTLLLISVFHSSCRQNQTNAAQDNIKAETKDKVTSSESDEKYHTKYAYTESIDFSGEWKLNESISKFGRKFSLCFVAEALMYIDVLVALQRFYKSVTKFLPAKSFGLVQA